MKYLRWIWPIITHILVAAIFFGAGFYLFFGLAIGGAMNQCGTDTEYTLARSEAGDRAVANDTVCDWMAPGHEVRIYRIGANGAQQEPILRYSAMIFHVPRASWSPGGQLVIEVPPIIGSLSADPGLKSDVTIKFGRIL